MHIRSSGQKHISRRQHALTILTKKHRYNCCGGVCVRVCPHLHTDPTTTMRTPDFRKKQRHQGTRKPTSRPYATRDRHHRWVSRDLCAHLNLNRSKPKTQSGLRGGEGCPRLNDGCMTERNGPVPRSLHSDVNRLETSMTTCALWTSPVNTTRGQGKMACF